MKSGVPALDPLASLDGAGEHPAVDRALHREVRDVALLLGELRLGLPALPRERVALRAQDLDLLEARGAPGPAASRLLSSASSASLTDVLLDVGLEPGVLALLRGDRAPSPPAPRRAARPARPAGGSARARRSGLRPRAAPPSPARSAGSPAARSCPSWVFAATSRSAERIDLLLGRPHALALGLIVQRREELALAHGLPLVRVQGHDPRRRLRRERRDAALDAAAREDQARVRAAGGATRRAAGASRRRDQREHERDRPRRRATGEADGWGRAGSWPSLSHHLASDVPRTTDRETALSRLSGPAGGGVRRPHSGPRVGRLVPSAGP